MFQKLFSNKEHLLHHTRPKHSYTSLDASNLTNIHTHHCHALRNLLKLSWDNSGQKRYNRDTNRHPATSQTPKKAVWGCVAVQVDIKWWLLLSFGAWWCLLVSHVVWRSGEGVWGFSQRVSECCLWTRVRFGASEGVSEYSGLVLYSKCSSFESQNSTHLTLLKHQNTKTAL